MRLNRSEIVIFNMWFLGATREADTLIDASSENVNSQWLSRGEQVKKRCSWFDEAPTLIRGESGRRNGQKNLNRERQLMDSTIEGVRWCM